MVSKKKGAVKKKKKKSVSAPASPATPVVSARISVPAQEFKFGYGKHLFPEDRPIVGADIESLKKEAGYDLNTIEASLGISRRDYYYELRDEVGDRQLPDIAMAILIRMYEAFPKELLPFQSLSWAEYLQIIGVHPGEFAQLVGREFNAGRTWQEGSKPIRSVQLIVEAFWRAGVTDTNHPVYQAFLKISENELKLRSKIWLSATAEEDVWVRTKVIEELGEEQGLIALYRFNEKGTIIPALERDLGEAVRKGEELTKEQALRQIVKKVVDRKDIKKAPAIKRKRRAKALAEAEDSLMQPVAD